MTCPTATQLEADRLLAQLLGLVRCLNRKGGKYRFECMHDWVRVGDTVKIEAVRVDLNQDDTNEQLKKAVEFMKKQTPGE